MGEAAHDRPGETFHVPVRRGTGRGYLHMEEVRAPMPDEWRAYDPYQGSHGHWICPRCDAARPCERKGETAFIRCGQCKTEFGEAEWLLDAAPQPASVNAIADAERRGMLRAAEIALSLRPGDDPEVSYTDTALIEAAEAIRAAVAEHQPAQVSSLSFERLAEIEAVAKAAPDGPWRATLCDDGVWMVASVGDVICLADPNCREPDGERPIAHIASMDPPTTLALVADVRSLARRLAETEHKRRGAEALLSGFRQENARLAAALETAIRVAAEARLEWDRAPSGMKAGKLLIALGDPSLKYRSDITAMHQARGGAHG